MIAVAANQGGGPHLFLPFGDELVGTLLDLFGGQPVLGHASLNTTQRYGGYGGQPAPAPRLTAGERAR